MKNITKIACFALAAFLAIGVSASFAQATETGARLEISATADKTIVERDGKAGFTIRVKNTGSVAASNVHVVDPMTNSGVTFLSNESSGNCSLVGNNIECRMNTLNPGQEINLWLVFKVKNDATCNSEIKHRATVTANGIASVTSNEAKTRISCPTPADCVPNQEVDLRAHFIGTSGAQITNTSEHCSYKVGLASYKMFDRVIVNQQLFDSEVVTIAPRQTITLNVDAPTCAYQIDAFYGDLITNFSGTNLYGDRLLTGEMRVTNDNFCSNTPNPQRVTIVTDKVVCDSEADLPNWSAGSTNITESTARNFVNSSNGKCRLVSGWDFQWGYGPNNNSNVGRGGVISTPGDHIGNAPTNRFSNDAYDQWKTLGTTNSNGRAQTTVDLNGARYLWVREVLKSGYVPFSVGESIPAVSQQSNYSAEMWCGVDVLNYDNYDRIDNPQAGQTYYCAAFNALKNNPNPNLDVTCEPNNQSYNVGSSVNWNANATGGNGSYSYSWTGTDGLSANSRSISKTYNSTGWKTATVTVTSGNQSDSAQCGVNIVNPTSNLAVTCEPNNQNFNTGSTVNWRSNATGGNGSYSYSWNGTDGLSSNDQNVSRSYSSTGSKNATVTVTSNGQSASAQCVVNIVNQNNDNFSVTCEADDRSIDEGERITWSADVQNAPGSVDYDWSGSNGLDGDERRVTKRYTSSGDKYAEVRVTSNGQTRTARCEAEVDDEDNNDDDDLDGYCRASETRPKVGESVRFTAYPDNGRNYRYDWEGDDGILSDDKSFTHSFDTAGRKDVEVEVRSGSERETFKCPVTVVDDNNNQVAGIYLTQIPYTGIKENAAVAGFVAALMTITGGAAYVFLKRKTALATASVAASVAPVLSATPVVDPKIGFSASIEDFASSLQTSVSADLIDALYVSGKGNIDWAKSALSQIAKVQESETEWKFVTLDSAKKVYPYLG
ncbi:MAG TPA: PKD domain-containing protein [Candidatus Paceibacterota bacterium]|nr:PKD domain-containing protein [Candidatus Paceibacterota bacterium]